MGQFSVVTLLYMGTEENWEIEYGASKQNKYSNIWRNNWKK